MVYNTTSIKEVIAKIFRDFRPEQSNWIHDAYEWIGEALEYIGAGPNVIEKYDFIEIMACPGGCIGGGGQPFTFGSEAIKSRMKAIYQVDETNPVRKSHENPVVKELYQDFLEKPLSHRSHQLLHTSYTERNRF